jgi:hypothetical protein
MVGCVRGQFNSGSCGPSAMAGAFGKLTTIGTDKIGVGPAQFVASTIAGGTASVIGGGKFANGAFQAAFGYVFNQATQNARRLLGRPTLPGGLSLAEFEKKFGGHAVAEHVLITDARLMQQVASGEKMMASRFTSMEVAENSIAQTLAANEGRILRWMGDAKVGGRMDIDNTFSKPIGHGYLPGMEAPVQSQTMRVVIEKLDCTWCAGYRILTAFPRILP